MLALSEALYNVLSSDATLVALLGKFDGRPSIFTRRPVPTEATFPVLLAATTVADNPMDLIGKSVGRLIDRDVVVYGSAAKDHDSIILAAERVKEVLHHNRFPVAGWNTLMTLCRGPVDAPADPQEIARAVTMTIRLQRFG